MLLFAIAQRFKFGCGFTRHLFHQGSPLEAALLPRKPSPSAVGIYPVTDEATESKLVCPSRKQRRRWSPSRKPRGDLRQAQASSRIQSVDGL